MFLVCLSALRRTAFICSLKLKSLYEHVQYHYEIDQYSAICLQAYGIIISSIWHQRALPWAYLLCIYISSKKPFRITS